MGFFNNINNFQIPVQKELSASDDDDDELSLCDLPLNSSEDENEEPYLSKQSLSSTEPLTDIFEFFNTRTLISSDHDRAHQIMSPAEDIIFCGKPMINKNQTSLRKRSESLSGLQSFVTRSSSNGSNAAKTKLTRTSRSLDCFPSNSIFSSEPEVERNIICPVQRLPKSDNNYKVTKPRWYSLMFGMVKLPATEMELREIKSRKIRRNPESTMFPERKNDDRFPVNRRSSDKGSWRLLRALSCEGPASVAVTASLCNATT